MKKSQPIQNEQQDLLRIAVFENPEIMGIAAAEFVSGKLLTAIAEKGMANIILATGASQFSFLAILKTNTSIDWSKIIVFHLDEYVGLPDTHPASFRKYLHDRILKEVKPKEVHYTGRCTGYLKGN
ncbi:MAG: 6-phosphogluconolactonase [Bacteroidales bacterium]|nr:6-phosphogluconolactonase [Bacteroidales bacterium]